MKCEQRATCCGDCTVHSIEGRLVMANKPRLAHRSNVQKDALKEHSQARTFPQHTLQTEESLQSWQIHCRMQLLGSATLRAFTVASTTAALLFLMMTWYFSHSDEGSLTPAEADHAPAMRQPCLRQNRSLWTRT